MGDKKELFGGDENPPAPDKSPLSMPLEKGDAALDGKYSSAASIPEKSDLRNNGGVCRAPKAWVIFAALFLFPFFYHLGSELYLLARTAIMAKYGPPASVAPVVVAKGTVDELNKTMAAILDGQQKLIQEGQKVIIIHSDYAGAFSYEHEKRKILELCGFDIDDPVNLADRFSKIKSTELLGTVMESLDRIVLNAAQNGVAEQHLKNTIEVKKMALKRIQELR